MHDFHIRTRSRVEFQDITRHVQDAISRSRVKEGLCVVYCPHTTAGITINENADPDVTRDMAASLERQVPEAAGYAHMEGNSDSHIKASMIGPSQTLIVSNGRPILGQWQGIYFCEFDGPRERKFLVKVISDGSE